MSDRELAKRQYAELEEVLKKLPPRIDSAEEGGPVLKIINEGLGKAIAALKTTIR